jgi:NTP pyrophosphatase (non-canonical NTP hydrolase)
MSELARADRLKELSERMADQESRCPAHIFKFDRNGLRLAIASMEDETQEVYDEWRMHKRHLGNAVTEIRSELLDVAAVAMLAYEETFEPPEDRK